MAISPDDFEVPVEDYNFSTISSPKSLIDQMSSAGGFTATKLATARDILLDMKKKSTLLKEIQVKSVIGYHSLLVCSLPVQEDSLSKR